MMLFQMSQKVNPMNSKLEFHGIQISSFSDKNGDYWFSSSGICSILNVSHTELDKHDFKVAILRDNRGVKTPIHLISERGVDALIAASSSFTTKEFKEWWRSFCLPRIHKDLQVKRLTPLEELKLIVSTLEHHEGTLTGLESRLSALEEIVTELQANSNPEYFSVLAYCNTHNVPVTKSDAMAIGRQASKLSKQLGIPIQKVQHEVYGQVGAYHVSVLEQVVGASSVAH